MDSTVGTGCLLGGTKNPDHPCAGACRPQAPGCSGRIGVHSHAKRHSICHACHKTFAETTGTMLYDLKHPAWLVLLVLALLSRGLSYPAIVFAFGVRTYRC